MSHFKDKALIVSNSASNITPTVSGDISLVARGGKVYSYDGSTESILAYTTDISGGSGSGTVNGSGSSVNNIAYWSNTNSLSSSNDIFINIDNNNQNASLRLIASGSGSPFSYPMISVSSSQTINGDYSYNSPSLQLERYIIIDSTPLVGLNDQQANLVLYNNLYAVSLTAQGVQNHINVYGFSNIEANVTYAKGIYIENSVSQPIQINELYGNEIKNFCYGSMTGNNVRGLQINNIIDNSFVINDIKGIYIDNEITNGASVNNSYGVYIAATPDIGIRNDKYSIFTASTAGNVRIGDSLIVDGSISASNFVIIPQDDPTEGFSPNNNDVISFNNKKFKVIGINSTVTDVTANFPPSPVPGQELYITIYDDLGSLSNLVLVPTSGHTIAGNVNSITPTTPVGFVFVNGINVWSRIR